MKWPINHNATVTKQAYAYLRVSSEEQVTNFSLDNQKDYCLREAERQEYEIVSIYREEGVSAKTIKRPQLLSLLEDCRKNKDTISAIFIYKIDRISRETFDYLAIKRRLAEYGIRIISVTEPTEDNPTGEFLETLLAATAKLDNATKGLRTQDGMRKRLESGWANGRAPVGYLNSLSSAPESKPIIAPDPEQFDLVKKSWDEMATGIYSLDLMSGYMNKLGIVIKIGKRTLPISRGQQTQRIFRNKFYCGYVVNKKFGIDKIGNHQAMISEDLFYKVQAIIDGRSYTAGIHQKKQHEDFPLRGQVICGICNQLLTASFSRGRSNKYPYYFCGRGKHPSPSIPKNKFEDEFMTFMRELEPKANLVRLFTAMVKEKWQKRYEHVAEHQKALERELEALKELKSRIVEKNLKGIYSDEVYQEQTENIENQILVIRSSLSEAKLQKIDIDIVANFMNNFLWNLAKAWQEGTLSQRKILTGSIYPKNVIYDFPRFRTTDLGPCFKLISQFKNTPPSLWVAEGTRTPDLKLHKLPL